jgi:hypothetical protein
MAKLLRNQIKKNTYRLASASKEYYLLRQSINQVFFLPFIKLLCIKSAWHSNLHRLNLHLPIKSAACTVNVYLRYCFITFLFITFLSNKHPAGARL